MMRAKDKKKGPLVPRLRFPEFRDAGEWESKKLDDICTRILQKVTDDSLVPVSITAGQGFVSQESKFGKNISGAQYKNYIFLKYGDFAYNKGNSKKFPQGYVCQLKEFKQAAASSAFLCFRFTIKYQATFFQSLFDNNIHGKQLVKYITSSARSDGLLNIKPDIFFSILLPVPHLYSEQQRIADCLSSLDERIAAETNKLDALKDHKKGLLKQLFPAEGETLPQLRFPEFRDGEGWQKRFLDEYAEVVRGGSPRPIDNFLTTERDGLNWLKIGDINKEAKYVVATMEKVRAEALSKTREIDPGDLILSNSMSFGRPYISKIKACIHDGRIAIKKISKKLYVEYIYYLISSPFSQQYFTSNAAGSGVQNLNADIIKSLPILFPNILEQQRIADCLSSLDELIASQTQKIDLLKDHKKGLMQQLFPFIDEVRA